MNTWQGMMNIGNQFFNQQNWPEAERYYEDAIFLLEERLVKNPRCVESIQGWICAYHNLAELFNRAGKFEDAQRCLFIPHQSMLRIYQDQQSDEDLQLIALKAIKLTLNPLLEFAKEHPPCEACLAELESQLELAYGDQRTYH
ncbi:hypothetical protein F9L16_16775 [Agarivorans sp. B2Z047]|uniref:hypothetical protein n=1 Tax=Agarivorans sp. B2Z047 TaxID=2652721 RepID=UPI00128BE8F5|nr:hypothetical protein [Agarivorans sp. B2Z047]MPW30640.1 hypothetical protein [Agarivorans sp. B2Z047]UQN42137.1 hypothetical protein LQZ07_20560 [Agarivorans sp. B2Z047]